MDQKVTTQDVLGELDERGVKFATLRMRSPSLMRHISSLARQGLHDDHPGPARPAQQAQSPRGPRREADQLPRHRPPARSSPAWAATAHRHHHQRRPDQDPRAGQPVRPPDDHRAAARRDHPRVLRRRPVLHRQPQRRPRRHARRPRPGPHRRAARPAARLRHRHPRHHPAALPRNPRPDHHHRDTITVRLERRAFSPVLRKADLPAATPVPWWGGRTIRYEIT